MSWVEEKHHQISELSDIAVLGDGYIFALVVLVLISSRIVCEVMDGYQERRFGAVHWRKVGLPRILKEAIHTERVHEERERVGFPCKDCVANVPLRHRAPVHVSRHK